MHVRRRLDRADVTQPWQEVRLGYDEAFLQWSGALRAVEQPENAVFHDGTPLDLANFRFQEGLDFAGGVTPLHGTHGNAASHMSRSTYEIDPAMVTAC